MIISIVLTNNSLNQSTITITQYKAGASFKLKKINIKDVEREMLNHPLGRFKMRDAMNLFTQAEQVNGKSDNMDKIKEFKGFEALYSLKNTKKSTNVG